MLDHQVLDLLPIRRCRRSVAGPDLQSRRGQNRVTAGKLRAQYDDVFAAPTAAVAGRIEERRLLAAKSSRQFVGAGEQFARFGLRASVGAFQQQSYDITVQEDVVSDVRRQ